MNLEMTEKIDLEYQENVAIISICNPPVNSLSVDVRKGLLDALKEVEKNPPSRSAKLRAVKRKGINKVDTEFIFEKFKYLLEIENMVSEL